MITAAAKCRHCGELICLYPYGWATATGMAGCVKAPLAMVGHGQPWAGVAHEPMPAGMGGAPVTAYRVRRDVSRSECPWLADAVTAGTIVWAWPGATFGLCSGGGIAVTAQPLAPPWQELPADALEALS